MKKFFLFSTTILLTVFFISSIGLAQKVNFTGFWKLNAEKSDFGTTPTPDELTVNIKHEGINFEFEQHVVNQMGDQKQTLKYTTDGKKCMNTVQGVEFPSVCKWKENVLIIDADMEMQGVPVKIINEFSLSENKKLLSLKLIFSGPMGDVKATYVFNKSEAPPPPPK